MEELLDAVGLLRTDELTERPLHCVRFSSTLTDNWSELDPNRPPTLPLSFPHPNLGRLGTESGTRQELRSLLSMHRRRGVQPFISCKDGSSHKSTPGVQVQTSEHPRSRPFTSAGRMSMGLSKLTARTTTILQGAPAFYLPPVASPRPFGGPS